MNRDQHLKEALGSSNAVEKLYAVVWPKVRSVFDRWKGSQSGFSTTLLFDLLEVREILGKDLHKTFPIKELKIKLKFAFRNYEEINMDGGFIETDLEEYNRVLIQCYVYFPKGEKVNVEEAYDNIKYVLRHELHHAYEKSKNKKRNLLSPLDSMYNIVSDDYPKLSELLWLVYLTDKSELNANIASYDSETQYAKKLMHQLGSFNKEEYEQLLLQEAEDNSYSKKTFHKNFGQWLLFFYNSSAKNIRAHLSDEQLRAPQWLLRLKDKNMTECLMYLEMMFKKASNQMFRKISKRTF